MTTLTIQPKTGSVNQARPYPYHIDATTGNVGHQDFWRGEPAALIGFQTFSDVQRVNLHMKDFATNPQKALGMYPVFVTSNGQMYNETRPIESVVTAQ